MSHPLVTVNGKEWTKYLDHFQHAIGFLALQDGLDEQNVESLINQYHVSILDDMNNIFLQTAMSIVQYLNFYNVMPTQGVHDEFKGIFYTGMAVSDKLVSIGLLDLNKYHLRAVLGLLDFRLDNPHKVRRPALSQRIRSVIDNNAINTHLGKYGWYLTYKCLYNSANEKSKTL